jgi:hypothetical protein
MRRVHSGARSKGGTVPEVLAAGLVLFGSSAGPDVPNRSYDGSTSASRTRLRLAAIALAIPLLVVPAVAYFAVSDQGEGSRLPVAQGSAGNVFHPVAGQFVADDTRLEECAGSYGCLEQAFGNVAYREGPKAALRLFDTRLPVDANVERDCHRIVHTIGSAAFALYDGNVARTFAAGSATCASGYYHGILERAFVGLTTKRDLGRVARSLCVSAGIRRRGFLDYQCRHGLGHGLMIQTGYDLPTALELCRELGTGWDMVTCTGGVFMENVGTRFGFRSPWLRDDDVLYPCDAVRLEHRRSCYVRASTRALETGGDSFEKAAGVCRSAGTPWARYCFRGFGRDVVVEARYRDAAKARALCELAGRYVRDCLYGAARTFADGTRIAGVRRAARFCEGVPHGQQAACVSGLGLVVGLLFPTDRSRREACENVVPTSVKACADAARAEVDPSGRFAWG